MKANRRISIRACPAQRGLSLTLLIAGLLSFLPHGGRAVETLPAASDVTRRLIERAQAVARAEPGPQYTYKKRTVSERLDAAGVVLTSEERSPGRRGAGRSSFPPMKRSQPRVRRAG